MKLMGRIKKVVITPATGSVLEFTELAGTPEYNETTDFSAITSKSDLTEKRVISKLGCEIKCEVYDMAVAETLKKGMFITSIEVVTEGAALATGAQGVTYSDGSYSAKITGGRVIDLSPSFSDGRHSVKIGVAAETAIGGTACSWGYTLVSGQ